MPNAGDVLRASDIAVQACRATRVAAQSITDNTSTVVAFDDEQLDNNAMHSTVTNNSRITIVTAGIYVVGFNGTFAAGADYTRTFVDLRMNGATMIARMQAPGTSTSTQQALCVQTVYQFAVNDYIEAIVFHDNTANAARNLEVTADRSPIFYAARIGS